MKEFLEQNPDYKNQPKEIITQRYELHEKQRLTNINRCIMKRKEIISHMKKIDPSTRKYTNYDDEDESEEDENTNINIHWKPVYKSKIPENNYYIKKSISNTKNKRKLQPKNKILITNKSYIMNNSAGTHSEITKDDINNLACIKDEKAKLDKKAETKDDHLKKYLSVELNRAKKLKEVKTKLNEKDEKIKKFMNVKKDGLKSIENDRYKDNYKIAERQKLYEKMLSNYEQKVFVTKKQILEEGNINLNKKSMQKSKMKMDELKEQIKEYEKKNDKYKEKITNMFNLQKKDEIDKKIKEKIENNKKKNKEEIEDKDNKDNKEELSSSFLMKKKINDLEEKFEIEKYRRESALMTSMNKFQDKINTILEKNEEKEQKIKNAIIKAEKEREEKRMKRSNHFNEVRENVKIVEKQKEDKRKELLEKIEKKNLKDFAIKLEKLKMSEERKKINKQNKEEREAMKLKIQEIINNENSFDENEENQDIIDKLLNEKKEQ